MKDDEFVKKVLQKCNLEYLTEKFREEAVDRHVLLQVLRSERDSLEIQFFSELVPRFGERIRIMEAIRCVETESADSDNINLMSFEEEINLTPNDGEFRDSENNYYNKKELNTDKHYTYPETFKENFCRKNELFKNDAVKKMIEEAQNGGPPLAGSSESFRIKWDGILVPDKEKASKHISDKDDKNNYSDNNPKRDDDLNVDCDFDFTLNLDNDFYSDKREKSGGKNDFGKLSWDQNSKLDNYYKTDPKDKDKKYKSPNNQKNDGDYKGPNDKKNDNDDKGPQKTNNKLKKAAIIGGATLAVGGLAAVGAVLAAPIALGAAGFGAGGVVAGSAAAAIQSWIGAVGAGSLFAACQSAGAVGIAASTSAAIGAVGGAVGAAAGAGISSAVANSSNESHTVTSGTLVSQNEPNKRKNVRILKWKTVIKIILMLLKWRKLVQKKKIPPKYHF